jgi:hypothetical protein
MTIYNQYRGVPEILSISSFQGDELHQAAWEILFRPTWGTGYLIAQHVFSPETQPPIHPLGINANWTAEDADLSHAVVISLSASGKTARSCAWHLAQRPKTSGPLGILQISSSPNIGPKYRLPMATRTVTYNDISSAETLEWVTRLNPSRIVILDFGGRGNSLDDLLASLDSDAVLRSLKVNILQIGSEQKVLSYSPCLSLLPRILTAIRSTQKKRSLQAARKHLGLARSYSTPQVLEMQLSPVAAGKHLFRQRRRPGKNGLARVESLCLICRLR